MPHTFLFIIPQTPAHLLTEERKALRELCYRTLLSQDYKAWKALVIGGDRPAFAQEHLIFVDYEGHKEEKMQVATKYILGNNITCDYIIRLDDDDVFNPHLLRRLADASFDLYTDKYHSHWNPGTGNIAQSVKYWFPNTCIHKAANALSVFGTFPPGDYKRFKDKPFLIECEHNDFHLYYSRRHHIIFAPKSAPVYLRTVNSGSITFRDAGNVSAYMDEFGYWHSNGLKDFLFLRSELIKSPSVPYRQSIARYFKSLLNNLRALKNFDSLVISKK